MSKSTTKSPWGQAFDQGYACAVAAIITSHGESVIARDVLACNEVDPAYIAKEDRETLERAGLLKKSRRRSKGESA